MPLEKFEKPKFTNEPGLDSMPEEVPEELVPTTFPEEEEFNKEEDRKEKEKKKASKLGKFKQFFKIKK